MELVNREFVNTSVTVSIEALQIIVCKCIKDCFRYYIQKPDFRITSIWLESFIKQNKLDEKYSVKQTPHSAFKVEFKDGKASSSSKDTSNQQSYVTLPGSGIKIYKNPQANNNNCALKTVEAVIDTIAKNGIPSHLYDKICK